MAGIVLVQPGGAGTINAGGAVVGATGQIVPGVRCYLSFVGTTTTWTWGLSTPIDSNSTLRYPTTKTPDFAPDFDGDNYTVTFQDSFSNNYSLTLGCGKQHVLTGTDGDARYVQDAATLRQRSPAASNETIVLGSSATVGDGGDGAFVWDPTSVATDDGGTVFQVAGIITGRWVRQFSGALDLKWFGVSTTDIGAGFNRLFSSASAHNGMLIDATGLTGSYACLTTVNQTKSCTVDFGGIVITTAAGVDFWHSNGSNLVCRGSNRVATQLILTAGTPPAVTRGFVPTGSFPSIRGTIQYEIANFRIDGGADETHRGLGTTGIDISGVVAATNHFTEGIVDIHHNVFRFLEYGFQGGPSSQNTVIHDNYFYYNDQNVSVGTDAETTIRDNWGCYPPDPLHPIWLLSGGPKIEFGPNNNFLRGNFNAVGVASIDVLVAPATSQNRGSIVKIWGNHFGPEGENLNDQHVRLQIGDDVNYPSNYNFDVEVYKNTFFGMSPGQYRSSDVARTVTTGVCTCTADSAHGIPIGRTVKLGLIQTTTLSFNGIFDATATSTTALTWTQTTDVTGVSGQATVLTQPGTAPIHIVGPQNRLRIHDNMFGLYGFGAKCTQVWTSESREYSGNCEWYNNTAYAVNGTAFADFDGKPLQFTRVEPSIGSATLPIPELHGMRRYQGRRQRLYNSENLTVGGTIWFAAAGISSTGGKLGPDGSTTAALLSRTAAYAAGDLAFSQQFDVTQLPNVSWLSFWARPKCGGSRAMATKPVGQVAMVENATSRKVINPPFEMATPTVWNIASSTNATPIVITTSANHDYQTGDIAEIADHLVNTAANGEWIVTRLSATTFSLNGSVGIGVGVATGKAWHPEWRHYEFPVTWPNPGGGSAYTLSIYPGCFGEPYLCDFYLWHPLLADTPGQDYYPNFTSGTPVFDRAAEKRFNGSLQVGGEFQTMAGRTQLPADGTTDILSTDVMPATKIVTTNATPTLVVSTASLSRSLALNGLVGSLEAEVMGFNTASGVVGSWLLRVTFKNVGGGLVAIMKTTVLDVENPGGWGTPTATLTASNLDININAVGFAATNIAWTAWLSMKRGKVV